MDHHSKISIRFIKIVAQRLGELGGDVNACLAEVELTPDCLSWEDHVFVPMARYLQFIEQAAFHTQTSHFGLELGWHYQPEWWGALGYVIRHSPTVSDAFLNAARYQHVLEQGTEWKLAELENHAMFTYTILHPEWSHCRQDNDLAVTLLMRVMRGLLDPTWTPIEVHFIYSPPADLAPYHQVFNDTRLRFNQPGSGILFDRHILQRPVAGADINLLPILQRYLEELYPPSTEDPTFIDKVRDLIAESLHHGDPSLAEIASGLGMSKRTMQRRLAEHDRTFKQLLEDVRYQLSLQYLKKGISLIDISFLLGYSELSAFHRAFRRWTGSTPLGYR